MYKMKQENFDKIRQIVQDEGFQEWNLVMIDDQTGYIIQSDMQDVLSLSILKDILIAMVKEINAYEYNKGTC